MLDAGCKIDKYLYPKIFNKYPVGDRDIYCWILHVPNKTLTLFVEIDSMIDIS